MNISRLVLVTALALGGSSTGCLADSEPLAPDIEATRFKTLVDPGGGIGPNGLPPSSFHAHKGQLLAALQHPLLLNSAFSPQLITTEILAQPEGRHTLQYAIGCALPDSFMMTSNFVDYKGEGLLSTTPGWASSDGVMSPGGDKHLFACMAARLNPFGQDVEILLIGAPVPDDGSDQSEYTFNEALWIAKDSFTDGMTIDVWPLGDLTDYCESDVVPDFQAKFCGPGVSSCGVNVRYDSDTACVVSGGFYACDGERAIKTKLKPKDVSLRYGGCGD